jgi:hypothetical protein
VSLPDTEVVQVAVVTPTPAGGPQRPPRRRKIGTGALLAVVNGALLGVATVYISTHSVAVTVIAAAAMVALAGLLVVRS